MARLFLLAALMAALAPATAHGYGGTPPTVTFVSPRDGQSVTSVQTSGGYLRVTVKVTPGSTAVQRVTINGFTATAGANGTWSARLRPVPGRYRIAAAARDGAGLTGEAAITIRYSSAGSDPGGGPTGTPPAPTVCRRLGTIPFGRLTSMRVGRITCAYGLRLARGAQRNHGRFCGPGPNGTGGCHQLGFRCRVTLRGRTQSYVCIRSTRRQIARWTLRF